MFNCLYSSSLVYLYRPQDGKKRPFALLEVNYRVGYEASVAATCHRSDAGGLHVMSIRVSLIHRSMRMTARFLSRLSRQLHDPNVGAYLTAICCGIDVLLVRCRCHHECMSIRHRDIVVRLPHFQMFRAEIPIHHERLGVLPTVFRLSTIARRD